MRTYLLWREGWWNIIYQGCLTECLYLHGRKQKTRFFQKRGGGKQVGSQERILGSSLEELDSATKWVFKKTNQEQKLCNLILWWVVYYWPWVTQVGGRHSPFEKAQKGHEPEKISTKAHTEGFWWSESNLRATIYSFVNIGFLFAYKDLQKLKIHEKMGWDKE